MLGGNSLRAAVVGTIAALGLTTGVAPAVAADTGTWRIAYAGNRPTGYEALRATVATGPTDAWAFGGSLSIEAQSSPVARHWNVAQRWPSGGILSDSAVLSARDVWVFGSNHVGPSVGTWHYDGRSWQESEIPFGNLASASAVASDDIWAIGSDNFGIDNVVARWDGHAWTQLEVPGLPHEENHFPELHGIYAASSQDVWIVGDEYQRDGDDSCTTRTGQWTAIRPQRPDGKVLRVADVTTVPHSGSTWAVGEVFPADRNTSDGAVWVNGPLPR